MIHVKRGRAPAALRTNLVRAERLRSRKFYARPAAARAQQRYKPGLLPSKLAGLKEALAKVFHDKCAYCESSVSHVQPYAIEHFRPKSGAVGLDGSFSPDHYWWLTFEWHNLLTACIDCNRTKANRFPTKNARARILAARRELEKEGALLLDPSDAGTYPERILIFDGEGRVASEDERGRTTIEVMGLNRNGLVMARMRALTKLHVVFRRLTELSHLLGKSRDGGRLAQGDVSRLFEADLTGLKAELLDPSSEFLAMKRQFAQQWAVDLARRSPRLAGALRPITAFRTGLTELGGPVLPAGRKRAAKKTVEKFEDEQRRRESFSVESESVRQKEEYYLKQRLIERIVIRNFKAIHNLELVFPPVPPQEHVSWLMLLGENATGKTSVLQAVSLALMGDSVRKQLPLRAGDFVRRGCQSGHVKVFLTNTPEPVELHFRRGARGFEALPRGHAKAKVLSTAYGATRLLPRPNARAPKASRASRPYNLFDPFTPLIDARRWLHGLSDKPTGRTAVSPFELIARDIKALLLLKGGDNLYKGSGGEINVRLFGQEVELEDLSEGYRSVVVLAADIMSVMHFRWESMEVAEGIVIIDEIDSHLHPRWKMMLVKRLRKVFPHVQFLVTSHDPLSLRGLHRGEVVVMRRDSRHRPFALKDLPAPDAMSVEQILASEFFGLSSTVDPEVEEKFDEYYELLALDKRTKAQSDRLAELKAELRDLRQLGDTRRERLMLEAADEFLSKQAKGVDEGEGGRLRASTRKKIAAIWARRVR